MHPKGENNFVKKGPKTHKIQDGGMFTWKFKMAAIFVKIVYVIADPQIYRTFESIKNCQRCDFLKIFVIPGGNATPHKFQRGDTSAPFQIEVGGTKEQPPPLG